MPRGRVRKPINAEESFWSKVEIGGEDDCWEWTAGRFTAGYGAFYCRGRKGPQYAHRFSYELHKGPIPEGAVVRHRCDNPPCVNPDHLTTGTQKDNIQDAARKGRWMSDARKQYLEVAADKPRDKDGKWL